MFLYDLVLFFVVHVFFPLLLQIVSCHELLHRERKSIRFIVVLHNQEICMS